MKTNFAETKRVGVGRKSESAAPKGTRKKIAARTKPRRAAANTKAAVGKKRRDRRKVQAPTVLKRPRAGRPGTIGAADSVTGIDRRDFQPRDGPRLTQILALLVAAFPRGASFPRSRVGSRRGSGFE
jgi:hypothetical protein